MRRVLPRFVLGLAIGMAAITASVPAAAEEWPLAQGDYWDVTGIHLKDGGALSYATWLATEWRENQEFAKSKGWIKGYMVLSNSFPRKGEPDLYLVTIRERLVSGPEGEQRGNEYREWRKKTISQMQKESGNRAEFREVGGSSLLQELKFRN